MNIGIIVYSRTGNTLSVGEKIRKALLLKGHSVQLQKITAENDDPQASGAIRLTSIPDASVYDAVIFGGPVTGGQLSPYMKEYLKHLPSLQGKKVSCYVTQHFPLKWMGSTRSVKYITRAVEQNGAQIKASGIVQWSSKEREIQIKNVVDNLSQI